MADRLPLSFKDKDGNTMYRNDLDRYHSYNVPGGCSKHCLYTLEWCRKNIGPLTDFEYDEPAPEPQWYQGEHRVDIRCSADDNDVCDNPEHYKVKHPEPAPEPTPYGPCFFRAGDLVHIKGSAQNNQYEVTKVWPSGSGYWVTTEDGSVLPADVLELESTLAEREDDADEPAPEPTPRKPEHGCGNCEGVDPKSCVMDHDSPPEPGDRVRVTYEATLGEPDYDGTPLTVVKTHDNIAIHNIIPADAEITVLERATPAVPEDVYAVQAETGETFIRVMADGQYQDRWADGVHEPYTSAELVEMYSPLHHVERGPVIGGD